MLEDDSEQLYSASSAEIQESREDQRLEKTFPEKIGQPIVSHVSTTELYFRDPETHPPPPGASVHVLTIGGQVIRSQWSDEPDRGFIAWAPFPKIPSWAKRKLGWAQPNADSADKG